jgi:hypothetical protein
MEKLLYHTKARILGKRENKERWRSSEKWHFLNLKHENLLNLFCSNEERKKNGKRQYNHFLLFLQININRIIAILRLGLGLYF